MKVSQEPGSQLTAGPRGLVFGVRCAAHVDPNLDPIMPPSGGH